MRVCEPACVRWRIRCPLRRPLMNDSAALALSWWRGLRVALCCAVGVRVCVRARVWTQADLEDASADDFNVVQDRFLLGRSDEEAERHLLSEIEFSVHHRWVAMMDLLHDMATAMR